MAMAASPGKRRGGSNPHWTREAKRGKAFSEFEIMLGRQ
jgi:hypothetical protein